MLTVLLVFSNTVSAQTGTALTPLQQIKSGIPVQEVKCKLGYSLVIKQSNRYPYCVESSHVTRLLVHGWITLDKFEAMHPIIQQKIETPITKNDTITPNSVITSETNATNHLPITTNSTNSTNSLKPDLTDASVIYKLYQDVRKGVNVPLIPYGFFYPLPDIQVNPKISSNGPNPVKIISIGMSPNPLKVGDQPKFTLTYQYMSDKPAYIRFGCTQTSLSLAISPTDNVLQHFYTKEGAPTCSDRLAPIYPNQINTEMAWPELTPGFYQITKSGTLNVSLTLYAQKTIMGGWNQIETIQFNVNATK